jgi:putative protein-disulfide isomerase
VRRASLLYGFDPLCGWCYVFGPTMDALRETFGARLDFELLCGGLVVGDRVKPMSAMRSYLRRAYPEAEARSGVRFGRAFTEGLLERDDVTLASEPACRAIFVAREIAGESKAFSLARRLTTALYHDGSDPTQPAVLDALAHELDLPDLVSRWNTPAARALTQQGFAVARALSVSMYPTLMLQQGEQRSLVVRGYVSPSEAIARVHQALA